MGNDGSLHIFFSDQRPHYQEAILKSFGHWVQPERRGSRGPWPQPRLEPPPDLLYAQVVKRREKGRVTGISEKVVFGTPDRLQVYLDRSPVDQHLNTAFVERQNGTMRHQNRRFTRKTLSFSKEGYWFERQLHLSLGYYHFCWAHGGLREDLTTIANERQRLAKEVEAHDADDGCRCHRSPVDAEGALSRTTKLTQLLRDTRQNWDTPIKRGLLPIPARCSILFESSLRVKAMAHSNKVVVRMDSTSPKVGEQEPPATHKVELFERSTPIQEDTTDQDSRLQVVFEIFRILLAEQDLDSLLPRLLATLVQTMDAADAGSVWFYDSSEGRLVARGAQGYEFDALKKMCLSPGEGMVGKVFQTGQGELYPTPESTAAAMANLTPANQKAFEEATAGLRQPLSAVCVPLTTAQTVIGALALLNLRSPESFTQRDLDLLQRVAILITLAIQTALLREELESTRTISEANRLKAELISTLAHEMRTPLTSIKGYSTALLMDEVSFSPETQREFLQMIDQECDILRDLIQDLLESSIIDAGLLRLEYQPVRLPRLVQGVVNELSRRTTQHCFVVDFPDEFPILEADPDRLLQVLRNLLDNAIKYSPDGGLVVVRGTVGEKEVTISVADQGIGISPEHLNRLFEKFFRAKSNLGCHVVGSGLGLPIARTIVEKHGGRIWAESRLGQGSTFYFTLPCERLGRSVVCGEEDLNG